MGKKDKVQHNVTIAMDDNNSHALWVKEKADEFAAKLAAGASYADVRVWWEHEPYEGTWLCDVLVEVRWRGLAPPKAKRGPMMSDDDDDEETTPTRKVAPPPKMPKPSVQVQPRQNKFVAPQLSSQPRNETWKEVVKTEKTAVNDVRDLDLSK